MRGNILLILISLGVCTATFSMATVHRESEWLLHGNTSAIPACAELTLDTLAVNFGVLSRGDAQKFEIGFTNTGNAVLIIYRVELTCDCLKVNWSKKPILPGERGVLKFTFAAKTIGPFYKRARVCSNAASGDKFIRIKGVVR